MTHVTCRLTAKTGISSGTLRSVIEYGLPLPFEPVYNQTIAEVRCDRQRLACSSNRLVSVSREIFWRGCLEPVRLLRLAATTPSTPR